jgi:hypothetical protein
VNQLTQQQAIQSLEKYYEIERWVRTLLVERERLIKEFKTLDCCVTVFSYRCQFLLD